MSSKESKDLCIAFTQKKLPCKKVATFGLYCNLHKIENTPRLDIGDIVSNLDLSKLNISNIHDKDISINNQSISVILPVGECTICMNNIFPDELIILTCDHKYHFDCVTKLRIPTCPICRAPLESEKISPNLIDIIKKRQYMDHRERNTISTQDYIRQDDIQQNNDDNDDNDINNDMNGMSSGPESLLAILFYMYDDNVDIGPILRDIGMDYSIFLHFYFIYQQHLLYHQ